MGVKSSSGRSRWRLARGRMGARPPCRGARGPSTRRSSASRLCLRGLRPALTSIPRVVDLSLRSRWTSARPPAGHARPAAGRPRGRRARLPSGCSKVDESRLLPWRHRPQQASWLLVLATLASTPAAGAASQWPKRPGRLNARAGAEASSSRWRHCPTFRGLCGRSSRRARRRARLKKASVLSAAPCRAQIAMGTC